MRKIVIILVSLILSFIFTGKEIQGAIINEGENINFNKLTIKDGLSQTSVEYIYQDSDGYMWFATNDGLNRYDGNSFEVIKVNENKNNSLSSNYITCIIQDDNGYIWVGTLNGLNRIDRNNGNIKKYYANGKDGELSNYAICEMFIDSKDRLFISTLDGINLYDEETDKFERILYSKEDEILTSQTIYSMLEDENGEYWIATDFGLNRYNEKTAQVTKYMVNEKENSISSNEVYDLYADGDTIWISTIQGGLNKININSNKIEIFKNDPENSKSLAGNDVRNVLRDKNGHLWIATNKGLSKLNEQKMQFTNYTNKIYDDTSIVSDNILFLYEDETGVIWVATNLGISYFYPQNMFITYREDPFNKNSISDNSITGIYEDEDKLLWVGTVHDGINIINRDSMNVTRVSNLKSNKEYLTSDRITVIKGNGEDIWVGTSFGLNKINKTTREITKYFNDLDNTLRAIIKDIFIDSKGIVWIATRDGVFTIDSNDNIRCYNDMLHKNNIQERSISTIFEDSEGDIWIGFKTEEGVLRYDVETKKAIQYRSDPEDKKTISCNEIYDITEDKKGDIWIGTAHGLSRFNKKTNTFTRYSENNGLSNSCIYAINMDEKGNPWMSTNYGINMYNVEQDKFIRFSMNDGLQSNEFNYNSSHLSSSGEMFFGGINGFNSFNPKNFIEESYNIPIKICNIEINGRGINKLKDIELESDENNIKIKYFVPDYRNSETTEFRYKVQGVDNGWIIADKGSSITYNNIRPGNYTFEIQGRNSYGSWSESTIIKFKKKVPFWRSGTAIAIYLLILLFIIVIIYNKLKILQSLIKQRTKELDLKLKRNEKIYTEVIKNEKIKNNYFVNLSHELRTPLNVISASIQLIEVLNNGEENIGKDKLGHYMKVLDGNTKKLLKLINNIIDTSKIQAGEYKLRIKENDIVCIVEEIALSMKDYIESKDIELIIDPDIEEQIIQCDKDEIEKCVTNILGNAAKFTPAGGFIKIGIRVCEAYIYIDIQDSGIGIDKNDIDIIFERFGQSYNKKTEEVTGSGLGLALSKQLVLLHKGELTVESTLGEGSIFTIKLPINQI